MPGMYVGAAAALANTVNSMAGGSSSGTGNTNGQATTFGGGSGVAPLLAGGLASSLNPSQAQTNPGAYSPPSNIGEGYNYIPTGQSSIDQLIQSLLGRAGGTSYSPGTSATTALSDPANLINNNPYYGDISAPGGAPIVAQNELIAGGEQAALRGSQLSENASSYLPQLGQLLTQAFDPQGALYSKLRGNVVNQANVNNAAMGLGATPYGAGVANEATTNFDINWQNNQLARMLQGIGGLTTGLGGIGGAETTGANLQNAGGNMVRAGGLVLPDIYNQMQQRYLANQGAARGIDLQGSQLATQQQQRDLAPLGPAQAYMNSAQGPNQLSNSVAATNQIVTGNQNANAAAGIQQGLQQIMPWIGQGLTGLYDSIFGKGGGGGGTTGSTYQGMTPDQLNTGLDNLGSVSTSDSSF